MSPPDDHQKSLFIQNEPKWLVMRRFVGYMAFDEVISAVVPTRSQGASWLRGYFYTALYRDLV